MGGDGYLDLDLGANCRAHRPPGVERDGVPDDSTYRPAMPCEGGGMGGKWGGGGQGLALIFIPAGGGGSLPPSPLSSSAPKNLGFGNIF